MATCPGTCAANDVVIHPFALPQSSNVIGQKASGWIISGVRYSADAHGRHAANSSRGNQPTSKDQPAAARQLLSSKMTDSRRSWMDRSEEPFGRSSHDCPVSSLLFAPATGDALSLAANEGIAARERRFGSSPARRVTTQTGRASGQAAKPSPPDARARAGPAEASPQAGFPAPQIVEFCGHKTHPDRRQETMACPTEQQGRNQTWADGLSGFSSVRAGRPGGRPRPGGPPHERVLWY